MIIFSIGISEPRRHHPRCTVQILSAPRRTHSCLRKDFLHRTILPVANFQCQQAISTKMRFGSQGDSSEEIKSVRSTGEREARFEVAYVGLQRGDLSIHDVGWVRRHDVEVTD